jgi:hypothetical protein
LCFLIRAWNCSKLALTLSFIHPHVQPLVCKSVVYNRCVCSVSRSELSKLDAWGERALDVVLTAFYARWCIFEIKGNVGARCPTGLQLLLAPGIELSARTVVTVLQFTATAGLVHDGEPTSAVMTVQ